MKTRSFTLEETPTTDRWFLDGVLHGRNGAPAVVEVAGYEAYYHKGMRHNTKGPAIKWANGSESWYQLDKLHRVGGPALSCPECDQYYFNGRKHRIDGPAVIRKDGRKEYWLDGYQVTEQQFKVLTTPKTQIIMSNLLEVFPAMKSIEIKSLGTDEFLKVW